MLLSLYGGFGEKGRTAIGIGHAGYRLLIDAGVKTSAAGTGDYYPAIAPAELAAADALIVTHGHEDHAAALGWYLRHGFRGRLLMTAQTRRDAEDVVAGYAASDELARLRAARVEMLPPPGAAFDLGPLRILTGRSGHVAGGVWCALGEVRSPQAGWRFLYCGDVVPASPVWDMDALPRASVVALDASYADDAVPASERAARVAAWTAAHPRGCVLPTPLHGRSLELLAIVRGAVALAPGMRSALAAQIDERAWLVPHVAQVLRARLDAAVDWQPGEALPAAALLCHDGMGMAGPARAILAQAHAQRHPTLLTGHVPEGSPGARMLEDDAAQWIRLPTHPTRPENEAMAQATQAATLLGHSCDSSALARLAAHLPALRSDVATGARLELPGGVATGARAEPQRGVATGARAEPQRDDAAGTRRERH